MFTKRKRIFLDYAATTPIDKRVERVMKLFMRDVFANPSSPHTEGLGAKKYLLQAKEDLARIAQIKDSEIIFTSGGTESVNLAIIGIARKVKGKISKPHIITTNIEHPAGLKSCEQLEKEGFDVTYLAVNEEGRISASDVRDAIRKETVLISVMLVNNEIGTILPIREISRELKIWKRENGRGEHDGPYFHTDACQAPSYLDINLNKLGVDALSIDGTKIYGPKGTGALLIRSHVPIQNIMYGGEQSRGFRPGTENIPGIIGLVEAMKIADMNREEENERLKELQKYFFERIVEIDGVIINGDIKRRLVNNINICIPNLNAEFAVIQLDEKGIACSSASACSNLSDGSSRVIQALGNGCEKSSLRFSMGRRTKRKDIDSVMKALLDITIKKS